MKYENKKKVDEICNEINHLEKVKYEVEKSVLVNFMTSLGFSVLEIDFIEEDEKNHPYLAHAAQGFKTKIITEISNKIAWLHEDLRKL